MVQIDGKYQLTKNENFLKFVSAQGTKDAEQINKAHSLLTISKEGNKITLSDVSGATPLTRTYIIGETNEEELVKDVKAQTSVTLEGNKLSLSSSNASDEKLQRVYEFSDDGLTITYTSQNSTAKRYFKRL